MNMVVLVAMGMVANADAGFYSSSQMHPSLYDVGISEVFRANYTWKER